MTPLLILLYGFSPTLAVGTDLVYAAITKAVGTWQHIRQKTVHWEIVKKLAKGSVPGGILGVLAIQAVKETNAIPVEEVLGKILGMTFVVVSMILLFQSIKSKPKWDTAFLSKIPLSVVGFCGGLLVGLTSVGSGSLFMAILLSTTALAASQLVGTDVVHAFFLTLTAGALHASFGHVDVNFVMWLLVGSIPGILLGGRLTLKIPDLILRVVIIVVLLFTGVKML